MHAKSLEIRKAKVIRLARQRIGFCYHCNGGNIGRCERRQHILDSFSHHFLVAIAVIHDLQPKMLPIRVLFEKSLIKVKTLVMKRIGEFIDKDIFRACDAERLCIDRGGVEERVMDLWE